MIKKRELSDLNLDSAKLKLSEHCQKLETLRFHDLRHIAISRMWGYGMNALEISACSGHRDIKMLMRYSHYFLST